MINVVVLIISDYKNPFVPIFIYYFTYYLKYLMEV